MGYWYTQFGATVIPGAGASQDVGDLTSLSGVQALPGGGAWNPYAGDIAPADLSAGITVTGTLIAASAGALRTALAEWRALIGTTASLFRTPDGGAPNSEFISATLVSVRAPKEVTHRVHLPITLTFAPLEYPWRGLVGTVSTVLDTSPKSIVAANGGNARVTDAVITVIARGTNVTAVRLQHTAAGGVVVDWTWTGTLLVGNPLVIDCGRYSATNAGVAAYGGFALASAHNIGDWIRLLPGNTTLTVTRTGGSTATEISIAFRDGWA